MTINRVLLAALIEFREAGFIKNATTVFLIISRLLSHTTLKNPICLLLRNLESNLAVGSFTTIATTDVKLK